MNWIDEGDYPLTVGTQTWYPLSSYLTFDYDEDGNMQFPPALKGNVVFLAIFDGTDYHPIGTAFFLGIHNGDLHFTYLITCKHVVKDFLDNNQTIYIRANRSDKYDIGHKPLNGEWVYHKDDAVDVAIYPWINEGPKPYGIWITPFEDIVLSQRILKETNHTIREGDEVIFVGLFAQYAGEKRNFPIVRFGRIAMITDELLQGKYGLSEYVLMEAQAYPGNSGAPVYIALLRNGMFTLFLLGIVAGYYPEQQGIYIDPTHLKVFTHFGVSTIVPCGYLGDILMSDKLKEQREKRIGAVRLQNAPDSAFNVAPEDDHALSREDFMDVLRKVSRPNEPEQDKD